ncbi:MAG: alcohol dehydrogenase catalytic domain-containing protein [Phycisphaerales bacterium JB061]
MRALVTDADGPRLADGRELPELGATEALVRIEMAGLSSLDVACATGRLGHAGVIGHELVGVVEKLGERVSKSPLIGKRVVASPDIACGKCDLCRKGLSVHCRDRRVIGLRGYDGSLTERIVVPVRNLFEVPSGIKPEKAVLASAVADAVHVAHLAPVEKMTYVTVLGDGAGAILVAQVLAKRNASVRLVGAREERFGLCERWQIRHRHISEPGLRADQDVVVVCLEPETGPSLSGSDAVRTALGMLRPRGTLVLQGPPVPVEGLDMSLSAHLERVIHDELRVLGARSGRIAEGLEAIASGLVDLAPLITRRARLEDGVAMLRAAASPEQIRTIVDIAA